MTDRFKGVLVTFETDLREDDAEATLTAIRCIRGVLSVKPIAAGYEDDMAYDRVRHELWSKVRSVFFPEQKR